eukprot:TRINITY_DN12367_c0_g1_i1.p1 TRINITY_DN12367_c0_g1~~TRINITY_DN12367_c0_g1_i1.p1  ORF type:complete len:543 (+),score=84.27 TRINITY_DN12367_c0_g1_i1:117-1631(+)
MHHQDSIDLLSIDDEQLYLLFDQNWSFSSTEEEDKGEIEVSRGAEIQADGLFEMLPNELVRCVYQLLEGKDVFKMVFFLSKEGRHVAVGKLALNRLHIPSYLGMVSDYSHQLITKNLDHIVDLRIENAIKLNEKCFIRLLETFRNLNRLILHRLSGALSKRSVKLFNNLSQLEILELTCIQPFSKFPATALYNGLKDLKNSLKCLALRSFRMIDDDFIDNITANFTGLKSLDISGSNITSLSLFYITRITGLYELDLSFCRNLENGNFSGCAQMKNLKVFKILAVDISNGVNDLQTMTQLESLSIGNSIKLLPISIELLSSLENLIHLELLQVRVSTEALEFLLARVVKLQSLSLKGCIHVSVSCFPALSTLMELKQLNLSKCERLSKTNNTWALLAPMVKLETLNLSDISSLSNEDVRSIICNLPNITCLNISRSNITDIGLHFISSIQNNIKYLYLDQCSSITQKGMEELLRRKKDLELITARSCLSIYTEKLIKNGVNVVA